MRNIPSRSTIYGRLLTSIQSVFSITIPAWGVNFLRALSLVLAGEFKLAYLALASLQKNIWIDTCDAEMALRYGKVKLNRYPFPATEGVYTCRVTGTTGATIPGQTTYKSDDSSRNPGMMFILDTSYVLTAPIDYITLRALTAGVGSRLLIGDTLTATAPIINVTATATVTAEVTIPNAAETIEQYRAKVIASFRLLPSGDNAISYREEGSLSVAGVQQIYPYAYTGHANEINIFIEAILADSIDGRGTPTAGIITDVTTAIELVRPLGVFLVHYLPITLKQIDININMTGLTPFTLTQQALILTAITQFLSTLRPFIAGADVIADRKDRIGVFNIGPAIAAAVPGLPFGTITFTVDLAGSTGYLFDNGEIPFLNAITYV